MLNTYLSRGLVVLIILVLVVGPLAGMFSSQHFQTCESSSGNYPTTNHIQNKSTTVLVSNLNKVQVFATCAVGFANEYGAAITGLATIMLGIVTAGLVYVAYEQHSTTRSQLRAYIFVENAGIRDGPTFPNAPVPVQQGCPTSRVTIRNYGQTPAHNVRHWGNVDVRAINTYPTFPADSEMRGMTRNSIGPHAFTMLDRSLNRALTPFEIQALATVGQAIVVYGKITYDDVFGRTHFTEYALAWSGPYPPHPAVSLAFMEQGNRSS